MSEVKKVNSLDGMAMHVTVKTTPLLRWRVSLGLWLIRVATWVLGCEVLVETDNGCEN